jgi:hypothetical protein
MPVRVATLSVFANPWTYIDEHGRPTGVCPVDVNLHVADPGRLVGARRGAELLKKAPTETVKGRSLEVGFAQHKLHIEYDATPTEVPNTPYYCERVRAGDLFAADAKSAAVAGVKDFVQVDQAERVARDRAIADFDAQNGPGACAELNGGSLPDLFFSALAATQAVAAQSTTPGPEPRAEKSAQTKKGDS